MENNKFRKMTDEEINSLNIDDFKNPEDRIKLFHEKEKRVWDRLDAEAKRKRQADKWKTL